MKRCGLSWQGQMVDRFLLSHVKGVYAKGGEDEQREERFG